MKKINKPYLIISSNTGDRCSVLIPMGHPVQCASRVVVTCNNSNGICMHIDSVGNDNNNYLLTDLLDLLLLRPCPEPCRKLSPRDCLRSSARPKRPCTRRRWSRPETHFFVCQKFFCFYFFHHKSARWASLVTTDGVRAAHRVNIVYLYANLVNVIALGQVVEYGIHGVQHGHHFHRRDSAADLGERHDIRKQYRHAVKYLKRNKK